MRVNPRRSARWGQIVSLALAAQLAHCAPVGGAADEDAAPGNDAGDAGDADVLATAARGAGSGAAAGELAVTQQGTASRVLLAPLGGGAVALPGLTPAQPGFVHPSVPSEIQAESVTVPASQVPTPPPPLPSADDSCATPAPDGDWAGFKNEPIFWRMTGAAVALRSARSATRAALINDAEGWIADPRIYLDDTNGPNVPGGQEFGTFARITDANGNGLAEAVGERYLFTEGNEAIKRASALGFAFNQTRDTKYLVALLQLGDSLMRLPNWNGRADTSLITAEDGSQRRAYEFNEPPASRNGQFNLYDDGLSGHALDAAHVATAASMVLAWAGPAATAAYREALAQTIINQFLRPYYCNGGYSVIFKEVSGSDHANKHTIIHTTALMASLAVMSVDERWGSAVANRAYSRLRAAIGDLAYGPTEESYLYTSYELQWIGYLAATQRSPGLSANLRAKIRDALPNLSALSRFYGSCGTFAEPGFNDSGIAYRHTSRPLGLAAVRTSRASPELSDLFGVFQPTTGGDGWGMYARDGLAEILWAQPSANVVDDDGRRAAVFGHQIVRTPQATGCVAYGFAGGMRAWMEGNANDAPHGHVDFGSVVADFGTDRVLYNVPGDSTRPGVVRATYLHNTVGWLTSGIAQQWSRGSVRYNYWRNPGRNGRDGVETVSCLTGGCANKAMYRTESGEAPSIITDSTALFSGTANNQRKSTWQRELYADREEGMGRVVVSDVITSRRGGTNTLRWTWYVPSSFAVTQSSANTFTATFDGRSYALITRGAGQLGTETFGDADASNDLWRITVDLPVAENQTVLGGIRVVRN